MKKNNYSSLLLSRYSKFIDFHSFLFISVPVHACFLLKIIFLLLLTDTNIDASPINFFLSFIKNCIFFLCSFLFFHTSYFSFYTFIFHKTFLIAKFFFLNFIKNCIFFRYCYILNI